MSVTAAARGRSALAMLDGLVDAVSQGLAAFFVAAEIVMLFAGVVWRYGLNSPLVWVDELGGVLFLWLVSLGAVIALRRGEHMCMTVALNQMPPRIRRLAERFGALVVAAVTAGLLIPGIPYAMQQQDIMTPALQIPGSWEILGQLAAIVLLLYTALRRLIAVATVAELATVGGFGVAQGAGL